MRQPILGVVRRADVPERGVEQDLSAIADPQAVSVEDRQLEVGGAAAAHCVGLWREHDLVRRPRADQWAKRVELLLYDRATLNADAVNRKCAADVDALVEQDEGVTHDRDGLEDSGAVWVHIADDRGKGRAAGVVIGIGSDAWCYWRGRCFAHRRSFQACGDENEAHGSHRGD